MECEGCGAPITEEPVNGLLLEMPARALSLFVLLALLLATAAGTARAQRPRADAVVEARLVEAPARTTHCGRAHFAYVFRYEVLRVVRGQVPGAGLPIFVVHSCPESIGTGYGRGLRVGGEYRLELTRRAPPLWPTPVPGMDAGEARRFYGLSARWLRGPTAGGIRTPAHVGAAADS